MTLTLKLRTENVTSGHTSNQGALHFYTNMKPRKQQHVETNSTERAVGRQKCRLQDDVLCHIIITVPFNRASQTRAERSEGRAPKTKHTACLNISHTDSFRRK